MAPDTQQNLIYMIYFMVKHNAEAMLYALGIAIFTAHALYKPTRGKILAMWGCAILLFAFEYEKHILEPLRQQTIGSLVTMRESFRIEHTVNYVLMRVVPRGLPVLGWTLVGVGLIFDRIWPKIKKRLLSIIS